MKQYKRGAFPVKSSKTQPQSTAPTPAPDKQEIDAAVHKLAELITKDPTKAAKIFEAWLDTSGAAKKNVQKKRAA